MDNPENNNNNQILTGTSGSHPEEVFDIVDEALNQKLSTIIFHGDEEKLKLTKLFLLSTQKNF